MSDSKYPEHCPIARNLFDALSIWDDLTKEEIRVLMEDAAETLERQHQVMRFVHQTLEGGLPVGNA